MPLATEVPVPVSAHGVAQFGLGHHMLSISPQDNVERGAVMGVEVGCCPGIRSQSLSGHVAPLPAIWEEEEEVDGCQDTF